MCTESPEFRFEDIATFQLTAADISKQTVVNGLGIDHYELAIDPIYLAVCAKDSVKVSAAVPSHPCTFGACVKNDIIHLQLMNSLSNGSYDPRTSSPTVDALRNLFITVSLSGIRADAEGVRFPQYSKAQMESNTAFWSQATQVEPQSLGPQGYVEIK
tara:strand:- start:1147 stop:1620 length:474 start_codon:yes stop_codon:yes gene_type:complete